MITRDQERSFLSVYSKFTISGSFSHFTAQHTVSGLHLVRNKCGAAPEDMTIT